MNRVPPFEMLAVVRTVELGSLGGSPPFQTVSEGVLMKSSQDHSGSAFFQSEVICESFLEANAFRACSGRRVPFQLIASFGSSSSGGRRPPFPHLARRASTAASNCASRLSFVIAIRIELPSLAF